MIARDGTICYYYGELGQNGLGWRAEAVLFLFSLCYLADKFFLGVMSGSHAGNDLR